MSGETLHVDLRFFTFNHLLSTFHFPLTSPTYFPLTTPYFLLTKPTYSPLTTPYSLLTTHYSLLTTRQNLLQHTRHAILPRWQVHIESRL